MSDSDSNLDVFGSGLAENDWRLLKDAVLGAVHGATGQPMIPEHLLGHPCAQHLQKWMVRRKPSSLEKAARALVPSDPEHAWLALEKS